MYLVDDKRTLEDIILCAFRYAKPRHTYVLSEVIDFIKANPELITDRVKQILLTDTEEQINIYEQDQERLTITDIDYQTLINFKKYLKSIDNN